MILSFTIVDVIPDASAEENAQSVLSDQSYCLSVTLDGIIPAARAKHVENMYFGQSYRFAQSLT